MKSNQNAADYRWYFKATSNGQFSKIDSLKQSIVASQPGYYQLIIDRGVCPDYIEPFRIMDEDPVSISIDPIPALCDDNEWQLSAAPASGQWSGPSISSAGIINTAALEDGSYKALYAVVTPVGCLWKDSVMVRVDKLRQPAIEYNGDKVCGGQPVELTVDNVDNRSIIVWYGPDENKISGGNNITLTVNRPGTYVVEVTKSICSLSTLPVEVSAVVDSLFVPNVFTPDGDNVNDYFEVRFNGINNFNLSVFNRYGRTIFATDDPAFRWIGENAASGIYYWSVQYTTCWNESKFKKGWVHMIK